MEKVNNSKLEYNSNISEVDSEHDEDWLDDDSISDEEKFAYFNSLDWQPGRNLATEFGITSPAELEDYLSRHKIEFKDLRSKR